MSASNQSTDEFDPPDGVPATSDDPMDFLAPTPYLDFDNEQVRAFAEETVEGAAGDVDKAVKLFYAVRDTIRYNPYVTSRRKDRYRASWTLSQKTGWCVQKGILMAALARAAGIPARVGYADVRNHLASERLLEIMGTDIFAFHGWVELWLDGRWIKVTPVFNKELCEKFNVKPQEFDGVHEALFQEHDQRGNKHMEYLRERGPYTDLPLQEMLDDFDERYHSFVESAASEGGDFHAEAETQGRSS